MAGQNETLNVVTKEKFAYIWAILEPMLNSKVAKVDGKGLSTNDFTDEMRNKLVGLTQGLTEAEARVIISEVVNAAPEALDTLKELADALGNDPNFAATIATQMGNKLDKSEITVITNDEIDEIMGVNGNA